MQANKQASTMVVPSDDASPLLPEFFACRSILITGGTGFIGKVLVGRVLATCPRVARLHLLLRDKRGVAPRERLAQLQQSQVFDSIREHCPEQLDKLSLVAGDVSQPHLGLSQEAIEELNEVSLVIHCAATVKMTESLATAADQNVGSVLSLLDLCDRLPNLQALVHVSTAFSNSDQLVVEERVYPPPMGSGQLLATVRALPPHLVDDITPRLIFPKHNTYVFTKAIAESAIEQRQSRHYSVSIVRPSVVISSHRHPHPGWVEGLGGANGVVLGTGRGMMHSFNTTGKYQAHVVPVDIVADTLLAVCWETASDMSPEVRVYNCSSQENPTQWRALMDACIAAQRTRYPLDRALWYPFLLLVENRYLYMILELLLQTAPLYTAEYLARLCRFKTQNNLITVSRRLRAMHSVLKYFCRNEWHIPSYNICRLRARLSPHDRAIYNLDIKTVNWDEHYVNMAKGMRKYLLRQSDDDMEHARRCMGRLRVVHYSALLVISVLVSVPCCKLLLAFMSTFM